MGNKTTPNYSCVALIAAIFFMSCSKSTEVRDHPDAALLSIDGSSTVYPITDAISKEYARTYDYFNINVRVSGTGGGFRKFSNGEIFINNASRKIKEDEQIDCEKNGIGFIELEVAIDGIAVVVNSSNDWVDQLTISELRQIWKLDGAEQWSDIRSDWPDEPIVRYSPGDASGTFDFFNEAVLSGDNIHDGTKKSENDNLLVTGIKSDENAIGFFGLSYYSKNNEDLKLVPIDNGKGAILPDQQTIANGQYTPLSRTLYIYANKEFSTTDEGKHFLDFFMNNSARVATEVGYIPLSDRQYAVGKTQLR